MINLETYGYCEKCPEFEAVVTKNAIEDFRGEYHFNTLITCAHKERCKVWWNILNGKVRNKIMLCKLIQEFTSGRELRFKIEVFREEREQ